MKIKATELIWDTAIYPRQDVSDVHVSELADAIRIGEELPPIVIDKATKRIIDGVHRWRAYRRAIGADCMVECDVKSFKTDADIFLAAIELNTSHGLGLSRFEKTKCVLSLEAMGVNREKIEHVLRITADTYERLTAQTAYRENGSNPKERIPLKKVLHGFEGQTLTKKQSSLNDYAGAMRPLYYVNMVVSMLESGIAENGGEPLMDGLFKLRDVLDKKLPKKRVA